MLHSCYTDLNQGSKRFLGYDFFFHVKMKFHRSCKNLEEQFKLLGSIHWYLSEFDHLLILKKNLTLAEVPFCTENWGMDSKVNIILILCLYFYFKNEVSGFFLGTIIKYD